MNSCSSEPKQTQPATETVGNSILRDSESIRATTHRTECNFDCNLIYLNKLQWVDFLPCKQQKHLKNREIQFKRKSTQGRYKIIQVHTKFQKRFPSISAASYYRQSHPLQSLHKCCHHHQPCTSKYLVLT